ncbi:hypothetical protein EON65_12285 [archaeon]|nr:MAG: hypothetical protein EON65_12285 [archaeon]
MEHCGRFSDDTLGHLIAHCPCLQFLSIDGCNQSSKSVASALKSKVFIRDLFLNTCNLINDECVKMFIHSCYQVSSPCNAIALQCNLGFGSYFYASAAGELGH